MNTKTLHPLTNPQEFIINKFYPFEDDDTMSNKCIMNRKEKIDWIKFNLPKIRPTMLEHRYDNAIEQFKKDVEKLKDIKEFNIKKRYKTQLTKIALPLIFSLLSIGEKLEEGEIRCSNSVDDYSFAKMFYKNIFEESENCQPYYNIKSNPSLRMSTNVVDFLYNIIDIYNTHAKLFHRYISNQNRVRIKHYTTKNSSIEIFKFSTKINPDKTVYRNDYNGFVTFLTDGIFPLRDDNNVVHSYVIYVNDRVISTQKYMIEALEDLIKTNKLDKNLDKESRNLPEMIVNGVSCILDKIDPSYKQKIYEYNYIWNFYTNIETLYGYKTTIYPSSIYLLDCLYKGLSARYYASKKSNGLYLIRINKDIGYVSFNRKGLFCLNAEKAEKYYNTIKRFMLKEND